MVGVDETDAVEEDDSTVTGGDDAVTVHWNAQLRSRLRELGLAGTVTGRADAVVVDRRGGHTTPADPGELTVDGRRVVVVPDRTEGAPPVELYAAGRRARYGRVVRVLRWTVLLDARVDAAFESTRRRHRLGRGESAVSTDGGLSVPGAWSASPGLDAVGSVTVELEAADTSLAIGGFAAAVEHLR